MFIPYTKPSEACGIGPIVREFLGRSLMSSASELLLTVSWKYCDNVFIRIPISSVVCGLDRGRYRTLKELQPLQAADIIAFETYKEMCNYIVPNRELRPRRRSMEELIKGADIFNGYFYKGNFEASRATGIWSGDYIEKLPQRPKLP